MLSPAYAIAIGGASLSSETLGPLVALAVERAKNAGVDGAVLALGRVPDVALAEGDPVTVELGWDGEATLVFTGEVASVDRGILGLEVACCGMQARLAAGRGDRTFVQQSAGEVVSALAAGAGVDVDTAEHGIELPVYAADSTRSAHAHCLGLARRCGFDLYTTEAGALVFAPFAQTSAAQTFTYGVDVVSASIDRARALAGVAVVPESPASGKGDETASWLVKDPAPFRGQAGASPGLVVSDPSLRTKEAADTAAQARLDLAAREAVSGRVELAGNPDVSLGQAVRLEGMPDGSLDDLYQVLAVRHVLDRRRGFRTHLGLGGMP